MRALLQRVRWAQVEVEGRIVGRIEQGMLVYLGLAVGDSPADAAKLALKVANMRIFEDHDGKLNLNTQDVRGGRPGHFQLHSAGRHAERAPAGILVRRQSRIGPAAL
jgi:D-tyrosyl-tRNA(Tyr) deacylase